MDHEDFTEEQRQVIATMSREFELWLNDQIEAKPVSVAALIQLIDLVYVRLRTQLTPEEIIEMVGSQLQHVEELLEEGLTVYVGDNYEEPIKMPTIETFDKNPGLRDILAAMGRGVSDEEIEAFFQQEEAK